MSSMHTYALLASAIIFALTALCHAAPYNPTTPDKNIYVQIASGPLTLNTSSYTFYNDPTVPLRLDADIVYITEQFNGVPWNYFMSGAALPATWVARLNTTKAALEKWGLPVFLALPATSGPGLSCPANNASDTANGAATTPFTGCAQCYDFNNATNPSVALIQRAYIQYVLFMVAQLRPTYLDFAVNLNEYVSICSEVSNEAGVLVSPTALRHEILLQGFDALMEYSNAVYSAVKAAFPHVVAFPSVSMSQIMQVGPNQACQGLAGGESNQAPPQLIGCVAASLQQLAPLARDALALSIYPYVDMLDALNPEWAQWYVPTVVDTARTMNDTTFLVARTGFPWTSMVLNTSISRPHSSSSQCSEILPSSQIDAASWFMYLRSVSQYFTFINWEADCDIMSEVAYSTCPCTPDYPSDRLYCNYISQSRTAALQSGEPGWWGELAAKLFALNGMRDVTGKPVEPLYQMIQHARPGSSGDDDD